ncbi:MAG: hypothetical protein CMJ83_09100 [Planctomycetes bacterium]|nr:hypothetical protein [Planctomycetota bacterium]
MMLAALLVLVAVIPAQEPPASSATQQEDAERAVRAVLADVRQAKAEADGDRFFKHFSATAVCLGTDATERWTLPQLKKAFRPSFDQGLRRPSVLIDRDVHVTKDGKVAWFSEGCGSFGTTLSSLFDSGL